MNRITRRDLFASAAALSAYTMFPRILFAQTATFDYYISPTGRDTNAGTQGSPWSLSALKNKSQIAGKRIGLMDGAYELTSSLLGLISSALSNSDNDPVLPITYGGTASAHTVVEAVNPLAVTITTTSNGAYLQGTLPAIGLMGNYITLRGVKLSNLSFAAIKVSGSHILIENCEISDIALMRFLGAYSGDNCSGIMLSNNGTDLTIRNCYVHDVYNTGTSAGTNNGCLGPWYYYSDVTIEYCTLANSGHGIGPKRVMGKITARYNHIINMQSYAIRSMFEEDSSMPALGGLFHNNLIVDCQCITGGDDPQPNMLPRDTQFYSNTMLFRKGIAGGAAALIHWNGPSNTSGKTSRNRYYDNIFFVPSSQSVNYSGILFFYAGTNNRAIDRIALCDYNCWGQDASKFRQKDTSASYTTKSAWQSATGFDANSLVTDPQFVNALGSTPADFKLQSGSPCRTAGRIGGVSSGAATEIGAWGGATQVGHNFGNPPAKPNPPVITVG